MDTIWIILIAFGYLIVGRIFAQIYTNIEGFYEYDADIAIRTMFWPILLPYWLVSVLVETFFD